MVEKRVLFFKSHIVSYTKKDGTAVAPHDDKRNKCELPTGRGIPKHENGRTDPPTNESAEVADTDTLRARIAPAARTES